MTCNDEGVAEFLAERVGELGSCTLSGYLVDSRGQDLTPADIGTMTVTLTDAASGDALNGRTAQDVKDTNGGTLSTEVVDGVPRCRFDLVLAGDDHPIVDDDQQEEVHVATLRWTYGVDNTPGVKELSFAVLNLADAP